MSSHTVRAFEPVEPVLLGPVDDYFWRFEKDLGGAYRVTILFQLDGCIEPAFLTAALHFLQRRHPKLRARITHGANGLFYYEFPPATPEILFRIIDYGEEETPWREEARRLLQRELPAAGPLAEVIVLRSRSRNRSDLLLTTTHAIADGLSAIMLIHDLLTEYAKAEAGLETPHCPTLPLVTANRAKPHIGWRGRLRLLRRFTRLKREKRGARFTSLPETPGILPQSQWVHWIFSREETLRLIRRCRKEQTSMSGVLMAACFCAIMDCLPAREALFRWELPFSIREALEGSAGPVTAHDLGCFISNMNGSCRIKGKPDFWEVARRTHRDIQEFVEAGGPSFGFNVATAIYNMKIRIRRLLQLSQQNLVPSTAERTTLLATYYGVLNVSDAYGCLRPRACTFALKNQVAGPSLVMEALILGQRLNLGFVAADLEPAFWDRLQQAVRGYMNYAADAGEKFPVRPEPHTGTDQDDVAPQRMSVAPQE